MTRDEAIEQLKALKFSTELSMDGTDCKLTSAAPFVIDALTALGLLKLESAEDKSAKEAASYLVHKGVDTLYLGEANYSSYRRLSRDGATQVIRFLVAAGFKITKDGSSK